MADHDIIFRYFPDMNERQRAQVQALAGLYGEWNARINVISRRDIDNLYPAHILHSLAYPVSKECVFQCNSLI